LLSARLSCEERASLRALLVKLTQSLSV
jgi:hypothetical protein